MRILFIGDIVGHDGRSAVQALAPALQEEFGCDFCLANGENMAGGNGMSKALLAEFSPAQVDIFTSGDHTWDQREFPGQIEGVDNVLRPANFHASQPGRGWGVFTARNGVKVGVVNLLGRVFMKLNVSSPFDLVDQAIQEISAQTPVIFVDFHGEATSEKQAMGFYLDGRVTAVLGTHTHVPTADERILPGGTAFQCDVGMVGALDSVLGREASPVIQNFRTGMPMRFPVATGTTALMGTVVTLDETTGRATEIQRVSRLFPADARK